MDGEEGTRTVPCMMAEEEGDHDRKVEEEEGEEAKNIATNDNRSSAASNKDEDEDEDEEEEEEENEEEEDDEDDSDSDSDSSDSTSNDNDSDDNNNDEENNDNDNNNNNDEDKNNNNDGLSAYERLRLERIKRNRERLIQLGLESKDGGGVLGPPKKTVSRKRRNSSNEPQQPMQPTRKSRRSVEPPKSYAEPGLRELLISQKTKTTNANAQTATATAKQPSNKSNEPKEPKPRKLTKRDLRPTREIYDEFQAIRKHKRITLQQAKRNLRYAEREVQHWYRKATLQEKKQHKHKQAKSYKSSSSSNNTNTKQQWWTERDRQVFGTASALDFVHEMDARRNELETKMAEYDLVTLTPEQRLDREVARVQQQNKLKVLAALQVVPSSLEVRTLYICFVCVFVFVSMYCAWCILCILYLCLYVYNIMHSSLDFSSDHGAHTQYPFGSTDTQR